MCLAQNKLKTLKQGTLSAEEYFICFNKVAREAGWKDGSFDSVKIGIIKENMISDLIDCVYQAEELPNSYEKWQKKIVNLDRVWHRQRENSQAYPSPTPQKKSTQQQPIPIQSSTKGPMVYPAYTNAQHVPPSFPAPIAQVENVPMDIDHSHNCAPPHRDTKEWIECLCFYCRQLGHMAHNRPSLTKQGTAQ